jgi:uncharacterized alpha-E superfamily protein
MLARHAESLFWCGRYLERAEDTARMLDVTYHGLLESPPEQAERAWRDLLAVLNLDMVFAETGLPHSSRAVSDYLVLDPANAGAIVAAVARARENARSVRELIPTELWEAVNTFYLELQARDLQHDLNQQPYELYGLVKRRCQTVAGVAAETMPRDDGWRFLALGRMLERAEMTCRLLNVRYGELQDVPTLDRFHVLVGVLKSASAAEAYRKAYGASMDPANIVEFLLLSPTFPRSLLYCLQQAEVDLRHLGAPDALQQPQRILGRMRAELEFADVSELVAAPTPAPFHFALEHIKAGVREASEAIALQYFRNLHVEIRAVDFRPVAGTL